MLEKETLEKIADVWYSLLMSKKLESRTVDDKIPKEHISIDDQKKPEIATQLEKSGHYEIVRSLDPDSLKALIF